MQNLEIKKLAELLKSAEAEAQKFKNIDDGGTCNFDQVVLNFKGKRKTFLDQLENASGYKFTKLSGFWSGFYFVNFRLSGQGSRRTTMAETSKKFLAENGVECAMYYQMD